MKKTILLLSLIFIVLTANCQKKDQTFDVLARFNQGIQFGDGTIQNTAATGVGVVTWDAVSGKPLAYPPTTHDHNALYRPITYVPTWAEILSKPTFAPVASTGSFNDLVDVPEMMELEVALPLLNGIELPVLTQAEIDALVPKKGLLLWNDTDNVLQIFNGSTWKVVMTNL